MVRRHLFSCLLFLLFILMQTTLVPRLGGILEQADLCLLYTSTQRYDGYLGRATTDVNDHIAGGFLHR